MELWNEAIVLHWLNNALELLQRVCVVMMAAFVSMRVSFLRRALSNINTCWQYQLCTAVFFGLLAIIGTHSGLIIDVHQDGNIIDWASSFTAPLKQSYAIIGFRDLLVLAAGLFGGPWIGLGAGLLAGWERYQLGGFAGTVSAAATILQGLGAGLSRQFWPKWTTTVKGVLVVSILGTCLQKIMLFSFIQPHADAIALVRETLVPVLVVNSLGCLLFFMVMKDLDSDRLKLDKQQAELRALHAQVEPHFLNNTFNAIQTLISFDPKSASEFVVKLAKFMDITRQTASANSIPLADELAQLKYYLDFQSLRFPGRFSFHADVPASLMAYHIAPRSLQTLAENALIHGRRGKEGTLDIRIKATDNGKFLQLCLQDNGSGISPERLEQLGKQIVKSDRGGGSALYQMRESLNLAFGGSATLDIHSQLGIATKVILTLPKRSNSW
jgi:LytS/YehU family sensor histidine kinase